MFSLLSTLPLAPSVPELIVLQEMKTLKIITVAFLLAVGMLLYSGLAVGAFQHWFFIASTIWIPFLIFLGFLIRRRFIRSSKHALTVVGLGFVVFSLILAVLGALGGAVGIEQLLWDTGRMIASVYGFWFWLPFSAGVALGGFHRKSKAEQAAT
jgi:hypothetical protein